MANCLEASCLLGEMSVIHHDTVYMQIVCWVKVQWKKESFECLHLFRLNFICKFANKRNVLN